MSYLPIMYHTCVEKNEFAKKYHVNRCKACIEKNRIRRKLRAYEDMTKTSMSWDGETADGVYSLMSQGDIL